MTDDELIAIIMAHKDGKEIQVRKPNGEWIDVNAVLCGLWDYRIKPKPHYRPFKSAEEVMQAIREHGSWVRMENLVRKSTSQWLIIGIDSEGVYLRDHYSLFANLKEYSFTDGTPFGIKED